MAMWGNNVTGQVYGVFSLWLIDNLIINSLCKNAYNFIKSKMTTIDFIYYLFIHIYSHVYGYNK